LTACSRLALTPEARNFCRRPAALLRGLWIEQPGRRQREHPRHIQLQRLVALARRQSPAFHVPGFDLQMSFAAAAFGIAPPGYQRRTNDCPPSDHAHRPSAPLGHALTDHVSPPLHSSQKPTPDAV
jgi:hypothetical protein